MDLRLVQSSVIYTQRSEIHGAGDTAAYLYYVLLIPFILLTFASNLYSVNINSEILTIISAAIMMPYTIT